MKPNLFCKWTFAIIMAVVSCTSTFAYTDVPITSLDQLEAGDEIKIYPYDKGGDSDCALACNGDGSSLTSFSKAGDGDEWTLEDAGSGYYYLKNELGCYWAYQDNSTSHSLTCTKSKSSAVKVKITWDSKYGGVCFWNQEDGRGLNNIEQSNASYNWFSSPADYDSDTNTTFLVYWTCYIEEDGIKYGLETTFKTAEVCSTNGELSGDIEIPEYVEHANERFHVTSLEYSCFEGCSSLTSITLPSSITCLPTECFKDCGKISYLVLPSSLDAIGLDVFENAMQKKTIVCPCATPPECAYYNFIDSNTSLLVPGNAIDEYKNKWPWNEAKSIQGIDEVTIVKTDSVNLQYVVNVPGYNPEGLKWMSSNADVATVDEATGVVTGQKVGDAVITVTGADCSASTMVHVTPLAVSAISLPEEVSITKTDSKKLQYAVSPAKADNQKLKWTSNNAAVASVDETTGVVTANKLGSAVITATATDGSGVSASTTVYVTPLAASSLSITNEIALLRSNSQKLEVTLLPETADNKTLEWTSDNENVASVDQNGVVKGINVGTTNIIAMTTDGSNLSATCKVTVNPVVINLSTKTINLQKGDKYTEQTATVLPDETEHKELVWTASGNGVASVDKDGNITANKPGIDTLRCSLSYDSNIFAECRVIVYDENVVYVGGLYYILHDEDSSDLWATVTSIYGGKNSSLDASQVAQYYSGTISIPETIIYDGKKYIVRKVGNYAFNCQNDLQSIYVPRTVTEIESHAAIKAEKLNRVNVADGSQLVTIGEEAFKWCTGLKRFTFDGTSSLKTIKDYAFFRCSVLNNFVMPNTTLSVGNSAFRYNAGLKNIQLSTSLNYIDEYAFGECGFSAITLPESLANIQAGAFINNEHLQTITLPEQLQGLGSAAFENNSALQSVTFNAMETMTIGNNAFNQCPVLNKVYLTNMKSFAQTNFNNAKANPANTSQHIYDANGAEITKVVLPNGTKYVNNNAFNGCAYIESIVMPSTMDHVNDDILVGCSALKDVYCYATEVPDFIGVKDPSSMDDVFAQATLHVIYGNENAYRADNWWGRFNKVEGCDATGIGNISMEDVNVVIQNRHITVEGLADDDVITIVNTLGITVYQGTSHEVDLNAAGVYIMKVKGTTFKVNVK